MSSPAATDRVSGVAAPAAPRRRWRARMAALAAGLIVGALLAEALVLLVAGEQPKFPRHVVRAPWGLRYNEPGARYWHRSADITVEFRINAQGMRSDRDVPFAKPPGVRRIVSLGDSFTIGYEVDVAACFSTVLGDELGRAGREVEVLNTGVSGFSTAEELLYLERELWRYDPDLVLVSFYSNDLEDNLRTGLFDVRDGALVSTAAEYLPGGAVADLLNTNPLIAMLMEHSNALAFANEHLTAALKQRLDRRAIAARRSASGPTAADPAGELTAAHFERLYAVTRAHGVPLVIQSIPSITYPGTGGPPVLVEHFPVDAIDLTRPGLRFVAAREALEPFRGTTLLYWTRSHGHWTPFSHAVAGRALASVILQEGLLR